ncbi:MAG: sensor histidine kinase [Bacteroidota bacterium]|jgi:two-component system LytT family sensor kinase
MNRNSKAYWICQFVGWIGFILLNIFVFSSGRIITQREYYIFIASIFIGIGITHLYRYLVLRYDVPRKTILAQIIIIIFFSLQKANLFFLITKFLASSFITNYVGPDFKEIITSIVSLWIIFLFWNLIYFSFKYFQSYKRSEINALRYLASSREFELSNLKSQLNPHFMFNSMNSIRALVDIEPIKAKEAITKLSSILRTTLQMNKSKEIYLSSEIELVKDYLSLEKIRYEERLVFELKVDENVNNIKIPPFIIQSQVENAIKHGVSVLPGKCYIVIEAFKLGGFLKIKVSNTGKISNKTPETGVGFINSKQRLELLYGVDGTIFITEINNLVVVDINIPLP